MRKPLRFRQLLAFIAFMASILVNAQAVGINATGAAPDPNAVLDLNVSGFIAKRGLMIPRMTEAQRIALFAPLPAKPEDNGLLVYQTDTGAVNDPANQRGFWYYSAVAPVGWIHLSSGKTGWSTTGNTVGNITGANAEFVGTANLSPNRNLLFRTALAPANPAMQMGWELFDYKSGFLGLGTAAPATERVEVEGAIHLAKNAPVSISPPLEGTIRYGTINGAASSNTNLNWHWGTLDTLANPYWARLENAENLVTPPQAYAKDTLECQGVVGEAYRGNLSTVPVTQTTSAPCNIYSPFASNFTPNNADGDFRVQYLYRHSELVAAGLCFPATISAFAFYVLDQESLDNPLTVPPPSDPTTLTGEVRAGAAVNVTLANLTSGAFGGNNTPPYLDDGIRITAPKATFTALTVSPGWINFTLSPPITLTAAQNLIIDIVWTRNNRPGLGPKVELEDPGFLCTKWVLKPSSGTSHDPTTRAPLDDAPLFPTGAISAPTNVNPHNRRPVTRFVGNVVSPATVQREANYIQYDGGLMIGSPAWLAGATFHGPGTIQTENGIYDAGLLLSDHVFDSYFDGAVKPADAKAAEGYAYTGLDQLRERLERDRHLPNMPSRAEWEARGGASLGTITTGLWESVENQGLYITQLEKDLNALEEMAFGTNMSPQEAKRLTAEIQASRRLSQAQKLHLIDALNEKARPFTGTKP